MYAETSAVQLGSDMFSARPLHADARNRRGFDTHTKALAHDEDQAEDPRQNSPDGKFGLKKTRQNLEFGATERHFWPGRTRYSRTRWLGYPCEAPEEHLCIGNGHVCVLHRPYGGVDDPRISTLQNRPLAKIGREAKPIERHGSIRCLTR